MAAHPERPQDDLTAKARELLLAGRVDDGLAAFAEAVAYAPRDGLVYHERGAALAALGRYEEALGDLNRAVSLSPSARAYSDRGAVNVRLGRQADARADLRAALALDPSLAAAHMNLALSFRPDDGAAAARHLREAVRLGEESAVEPLERVRQELLVAATDNGTVSLALEAFIDATTAEDLVDVIDRFPFAALPLFAAAVERNADALDAVAPQMAAGTRERARQLRELARP
jgi:Flp pilus assembly protein TadD